MKGLWSWVILAALAAGFLYHTSFAVRDTDRALKATRAQITEELEGIRVLRAEYAYLTNPERIEGLAKKHLMIAATRPDQFMDLSFIPFRQTETGLEAETNKDAANKIAAPENVTLASTTVSRGQR